MRPPPLPRNFLPAVLLAGVACAGAPAPPQPEPQPEPESQLPVEIGDLPRGPVFVQLDESEIEDIATLLQMEDTRTLDAAAAARLLRASSPEVRGRAALAVGRIGDRAGTALLLDALHDSVTTVRTRAAFALGELADSAMAVITALSTAALRDRPAVAAEAAAALGRLAFAPGRAALDSLLERAELDVTARHEALLAAWRLPRDPGTMQRITRWTTDADPETRWRAAYALSRGYGPAALPALLAVASDPDERVRAYAVRALRAAVADSAGVRERAFTAVLAAAADPHPHVRIHALRVLPGYRDPGRTTPILIARLRDPDENVAVAGADSVAVVAGSEAGAALAAVIADVTRSEGLRAAALGAWMRLDPAAAAPVAEQWADSARWILRLHAARALARRPWAEAGPALQRLARDPHHLVAAAALAGADSTVELRPLYIERLAAEHPLVRAAAARALGRRGTIADFDVLLQAYDRARRDTIDDAALAILDALGRLRAAGVPVDNSFFLRFREPPADPDVYRAIRNRIGEPPSSWREPTPSERPRSFYVDVVRRFLAPSLAGQSPRAVIETSRGDIVLELAAADAPLTVHNFVTLIERGYYAGTRWHRVVPNFVIQDGDPLGNGSGEPGYTIRDEINPLRYGRGTLGMAHSGPDTGGAQFFITHSAQPHLDGGYTVFGRVAAGLDVVDRIVQDDPNLSFRVAR